MNQETYNLTKDVPVINKSIRMDDGSNRILTFSYHSFPLH